MGNGMVQATNLSDSTRLAAPPSTAERSGPRPKATTPFSIVVIRTEEELLPYLQSWDDLAGNAVEPTVFYESWMLLPALRAYGKGTVAVVLVFSNLAPRRHGQPLFCGLFPIEVRK